MICKCVTRTRVNEKFRNHSFSIVVNFVKLRNQRTYTVTHTHTRRMHMYIYFRKIRVRSVSLRLHNLLNRVPEFGLLSLSVTNSAHAISNDQRHCPQQLPTWSLSILLPFFLDSIFHSWIYYIYFYVLGWRP